MKTIKFLMLFAGMLLAQTLAFGQKVTIKDVKFAASDITASKYERKDASGNICAVIKVQIPTVTGIQFSNKVGNVQHSSGEYLVYVSPGIKSLTISDDNATLCVVDFEKAGIEVTSKCTYQVILTQEQALNKVFKIEPITAILSVNGQMVALGEDGAGSVECEVGKMYNYTISASGYETIEDAFMISPEDEIVEPINITLERKMAMVKFQTNVDNVEVLLDDESWGVVDNGQQIELPVGTWNVRLVADKYDDWMSEETVTELAIANVVSATLKKSEDVSKKLRSRMSVYLSGGFAFPLESRSDLNKENVIGYPVRLGLDVEIFIKRWLTFRPGFEFLAFDIDNEDSGTSFNLPLMLNLNAPLGKFNRNHFSVGVGPVIGYISDEGGVDKDLDRLLLGARIDARFTFNHIIIGVNIDYMYSKYMKDYILGVDDYIAPMVSLGYKF